MLDLSVLDRFNFEEQPVAINFLLTRPEGVKRLGKEMALCEMIREAQEADSPFYSDYENHNCGGGPGTLGLASNKPREASGWKGVGPAIASGMLGVIYKIFKHPAANRRTLLSVSRLAENSTKYTMFSRLDKLTRDPDILIITAKPRQAEIILRAYSYVTGAIWEPKTTTIVGCSWLVAYPYLTGKLNYTTTGLSFGMVGKQLWPEGLVVISIPYDLLPHIIENLQDMEWVLPSYKGTREDFLAVSDAAFNELAEEMKE